MLPSQAIVHGRIAAAVAKLEHLANFKNFGQGWQHVELGTCYRAGSVKIVAGFLQTTFMTNPSAVPGHLGGVGHGTCFLKLNDDLGHGLDGRGADSHVGGLHGHMRAALDDACWVMAQIGPDLYSSTRPIRQRMVCIIKRNAQASSAYWVQRPSLKTTHGLPRPNLIFVNLRRPSGECYQSEQASKTTSIAAT